MDGKYNFTTTDELNLIITAKIFKSLFNILNSYYQNAPIEEAIETELFTLKDTVQKLKEKKQLKLRGIISIYKR